MSTPPTASLVGLPAELRNEIWESTLTSSLPIDFARITSTGVAKTSRSRCLLSTYGSEPNEPTPVAEVSPVVEFNQAKYVNKQLYLETARLELKYNEVRFSQHHPEDRRPVQQLIAFALDLPKAQVAWLTRIILVPGIGKDSPSQNASNDLPELVNFCKANPQVNIKFINLNFGREGQAPHNMMGVGFAMALLLRGQTLPIFSDRTLAIKGRLQSDKEHIASRQLGAWIELAKCSPTLRIFPNLQSLPDSWAEEALKHLSTCMWASGDVCQM
ncbi:hypothetical protein EK21DRAFT_111451 [Setomelanomma holmii]|uniref:Uncharacterized protein n=1 Tax=Setomelanomma holmii TaxID=210430 RepID=A0A9P4HAF5_9PLEO|nr:hypothetical protein EK21DRAFT_111451 [Setomelanomma holmii]